MNLHKEIKLEDEICEHLANHGWLYAEQAAADYDRQLALFPADVLAWVQQSQPDAWEDRIGTGQPSCHLDLAAADSEMNQRPAGERQ